MKKYMIFCLLFLLIISGCIDKLQTQLGGTGWDQSKYEEYSEFYDTTRSIKSAEPAMFKLDMKLQEMSQDTEFDKTWYLVFYNYYKGLEASVQATEYRNNYMKRRDLSDVPPDTIRRTENQAKQYFVKSFEYRQTIEEMNPSKESHTIESTSTPLPTPSSTPILSTLTPKQKSSANPIDIDFVLIPAGEFSMGSPMNEKDRYSDEGPVHHIKIANAFYMGKYEITQKQWRDVMGENPYNFKDDNLPVEQVSWNDVQDFIKKLNEKEGVNKYRLPSEAEWEYAARAGTTTRYSFGDDESRLGEYAWYYGNSGSKTSPVGLKKPNPWGVYDIHGNVWEWVQDNYHRNYNFAPSDGSARLSAIYGNRVVRGGGVLGFAKGCRSAVRHQGDQTGHHDGIGFRLVKEI